MKVYVGCRSWIFELQQIYHFTSLGIFLFCVFVTSWWWRISPTPLHLARHQEHGRHWVQHVAKSMALFLVPYFLLKFITYLFAKLILRTSRVRYRLCPYGLMEYSPLFSILAPLICEILAIFLSILLLLNLTRRH